ncbi:MAG: DUF5684 domain-containing protein, partial [Chloroflexota bacterium]
AGTMSDSAAIVGGLVAMVIYLAVLIVYLAAGWIIFQKASKPGWAIIIPLFNTYTLLKICGRPGWWLILLFIPFVNVVIDIVVMLDLAKSFGRGVGFAVGLILLAPIFILILAFGGSRYVGPAAGQPAVRAPAF